MFLDREERCWFFRVCIRFVIVVGGMSGVVGGGGDGKSRFFCECGLCLEVFFVRVGKRVVGVVFGEFN